MPVRAIRPVPRVRTVVSQFRVVDPSGEAAQPIKPVGGGFAGSVGSPIVGRLRTVPILTESLILAQDERWRRASHMQVEREASGLPEVESGERVRNT